MRVLAVPLVVAGAVVAGSVAAPDGGSVQASPRPLTTAVMDPELFDSPQATLALRRARSAGMSVVRLIMPWREVAPDGSRKPGGFRADDPAAAAYRWEFIDAQVRRAVEAGLEPLVVASGGAPVWAEGDGDGPRGTVQPSPAEFGAFARAAAERYSGRFKDLPRVRYWQAWNEPNLSVFLSPQFSGRKPFSPGWYRRMVNSFAAAVKAVHRDNLVVAGGTAPFSDRHPAVVAVNLRWGPLAFMREFLCLSKSLRRSCGETVQFDVWSHHPYTSGGPLHEAQLPDDVSLGDLPDMKRVLDAAYKAGRIVSPRRPAFWITEFSWDSRPPDPYGVPSALEARWVAEGLYRMWQNGVSLVTWFSLQDQPRAAGPYQSGLYYPASSLSAARAKPALRAIRFPLVGLPVGGRTLVWGRTPSSKPGRVLVEQSLGGGWRRLAILRTDRYGIFQRTFAVPPKGSVRARLVGSTDQTLPFSLKPVRDRFYPVFGTVVEP